MIKPFCVISGTPDQVPLMSSPNKLLNEQMGGQRGRQCSWPSQHRHPFLPRPICLMLPAPKGLLSPFPVLHEIHLTTSPGPAGFPSTWLPPFSIFLCKAAVGAADGFWSRPGFFIPLHLGTCQSAWNFLVILHPACTILPSRTNSGVISFRTTSLQHQTKECTS